MSSINGDTKDMYIYTSHPILLCVQFSIREPTAPGMEELSQHLQCQVESSMHVVHSRLLGDVRNTGRYGLDTRGPEVGQDPGGIIRRGGKMR